MEDTIHFWGTQVEYEYDNEGKCLGGQTIYQGIKIFTEDSIFYFGLPYGFFNAKSYFIEDGKITIQDESFEFNIKDNWMYLRDSEKQTIMTYTLMSIPSKYLIRMFNNQSVDEKIKLSTEEQKDIDGLIYYWIRDSSTPKWNE